jgi:hypothetical protein
MSFKSKNKKREVKKDLEREMKRKEDLQREIELKEQQERDNQFKREKELYCYSRQLQPDYPTLDHLSHPIKLTTVSLQIPYVNLLSFNPRNFNQTDLDDSILKWKTEWMNIDYNSSNYTDYNEMTYYWKDPCRPGLDIKWFYSQLHYLQSLSKEDVLTIKSYSNVGYDIINKWCLDDKSWWSLLSSSLKQDYQYSDYYFPFFFQFIEYVKKESKENLNKKQREFINIFNFNHSDKLSDIYVLFLKLKNKMSSDSWKPFWSYILSLFKKDMNRIIKNAPKLHHCLTTWRGSKTQYWDNDPILFKNYTSSTLDLRMTEEFRNSDGYLLKIILPANTACLFAAGIASFHSESEIILATDSIFTQEKEYGEDILQEKEYGEDILQEKDYNLETSTDPNSSLCRKPSKVKMSFLKFQEYKENVV